MYREGELQEALKTIPDFLSGIVTCMASKVYRDGYFNTGMKNCPAMLLPSAKKTIDDLVDVHLSKWASE